MAKVAIIGAGSNEGMISNLPADCCAEYPVFVDRTGLHKTFVGNLPSQCAALNMTNVNVQRLTVEAALTGDTEKIVQACALDPLTSAVLTLKEIRDMAAEMLEAEREWLPQFAGKTIHRDADHRHPERCETGAGADRPHAGDLSAVWGVGTLT